MMLNKLTKTFTLLALLSLIGLISPINIAAQSDPGSGTFSLSPIELVGNYLPGDNFTANLEVFNNSNSDTPVNLLSAEMQFPNNQPQLSVNEMTTIGWVNFGQSFYIIPANSSLNISANVAIPADTTPGAYFPVILVSRVSSIPDDQTNAAETAINTALAFRINLNVLKADQKVTLSAKAAGLQVTNPVVINNVDINYSISNPTDYYVKPTAYLQIVNPRQEVIWRSVINDNGQMVYPGAVLASTANLQLPLFNIADVGQYTAEFLVVDSQFGTTDIIKTSFNVIPLPLIIAVAGILVNVVVVFAIVRKRRHHKSA